MHFLPAMVGSGPNREGSIGLHREDHFVNLERRIDHEVNRTPSVHTDHTSRSHSRIGGHVSHDEETRSLRLEIDHVHKKLCPKQQGTSPSSFEIDLDEDASYRPRSRTPPSESFSLSSHLDKEDWYRRKKAKSPMPRRIGNDTMSKALRQISKSSFTRRIDRAKLPR